MHHQGTLALVLIPAAGLLMASCKREKQFAPELVRHWICESHGRDRGLELHKDGTAEEHGFYLGAGAHLTWESRGKRLYVTSYGTDGEHGAPEVAEYTIVGPRLLLSAEVQGCSTFVARESTQAEELLAKLRETAMIIEQRDSTR